MTAGPVEAFVDFDGTVTDLDTFNVLVRWFGGDAALAQIERSLYGGGALRDVLAREVSFVRGSFEEVAALLERLVRIDETFAEFVARCRSLGVPVTIVSSGIERLIRRRLEGIGLGDLPVVANDVTPDPSGWRIHFRDSVPNGTDKASLVRAARKRGARTMFVGDGYSDFAAALAADYRFARRGRSLEKYLRERGEACRAFSSFADITPRLDSLVGAQQATPVAEPPA